MNVKLALMTSILLYSSSICTEIYATSSSLPVDVTLEYASTTGDASLKIYTKLENDSPSSLLNPFVDPEHNPSTIQILYDTTLKFKGDYYIVGRTDQKPSGNLKLTVYAQYSGYNAYSQSINCSMTSGVLQCDDLVMTKDLQSCYGNMDPSIPNAYSVICNIQV